jgi:hypothetical protein
MHTIQYIAVQADDVDHAFRSVKDNLETQLGNDPESPTNTWFDWFVTGGGRWSSSEDSYDDNYQGDVVHQSSPKFQEYLDKAIGFRKDSLNEYLADIKKLDLQQTLDSIEASQGDDFRAGMYLYPFSQVYHITMGTWNYNSYFFDIHHDSANMTHMKKSIDNGADSWYLVPVDFHF